MLATLFWFSLWLVFYSYVLYPCLLLFLSACTQIVSDIKFVLRGSERRPVGNGCEEPEALPTVAVIISAFNEEDVIEARIDNLANLDYPRERVTFFIGSDGSSDGTADILLASTVENLEPLVFEQNRGKASVLNDLAGRAEADILVFSDANTEFEQDALLKLVRHFGSESGVDAVCGELSLYDPETRDNQDNIYWQYERVLKFNESRIGGLLGANGAIYAIRREAFGVLPADTIVDDFTVVFRISLEGGTAIYDPEARAREEIAPSSTEEYKRRIRIGAGNYQVFHRFKNALIPARPVLWLTYVSHKVLRWYTPLALLVAFVCSALLALGSWIYAALFLLQLLVYAYSVNSRGKTVRNPLLRLIVFWVNMNISLAQGAMRYYRGGVSGAWQSTER